MDPHTPHGGSRVETIQVIGAIRSYATRNGIVVVMQSRRVKRVGYGYLGMKPLPKSRHAESHKFDALAHGEYYMVKHHIKPHSLKKRLKYLGHSS